MARNCGTIPFHFDAVTSEFGYSSVRRMGERLSSSFRSAPLTGVTRIPVVVHVVASSEEYSVTDEQINEQIATLNADFRAKNADLLSVPDVFQPLVADAMIEFALATRDPSGRPTNGIIRKRTTVDKFPSSGATIDDPTFSRQIAAEVMLGGTGSVAWPAESYLNIWTCHMDSLLGFAAFPGSAAWRDGVVISHKAFGITSAREPYDLGRTATHEVGHWLDLLHIWGDDNGACDRSDNVADTPNQGGSHDGKPDFPSISCDNAPNGAMFMNYMDYVDDSAMFMFTRGQVDRMHATLQGARAGLRVSKGLSRPVAESGGKASRLLIAKSAFQRMPQSGEQIFDGVDWVPLP